MCAPHKYVEKPIAGVWGGLARQNEQPEPGQPENRSKDIFNVVTIAPLLAAQRLNDQPQAARESYFVSAEPSRADCWLHRGVRQVERARCHGGVALDLRL